MDRFPEAFERFEQTVDLTGKSRNQVLFAYEEWQGYRATARQRRALMREAESYGFFEERGEEKTRQVTIDYTPQQPSFETQAISYISKTGKEFSVTRYRDKKTGRFISNPYS